MLTTLNIALQKMASDFKRLCAALCHSTMGFWGVVDFKLWAGGTLRGVGGRGVG